MRALHVALAFLVLAPSLATAQAKAAAPTPAAALDTLAGQAQA